MTLFGFIPISIRMANFGDLEKLLAGRGCSPAKLETVGRQLRDIAELPNAGRGPRAPEINATHAASVLIATAGSLKAKFAADRLIKLRGIISKQDGRTLIEATVQLLESTEGVRTLRISRRRRAATLLFADGSEVTFAPISAKPRPGRYDVEGVFEASILQDVGALLRGEPTDSSSPEDEEESE